MYVNNFLKFLKSKKKKGYQFEKVDKIIFKNFTQM